MVKQYIRDILNYLYSFFLTQNEGHRINFLSITKKRARKETFKCKAYRYNFLVAAKTEQEMMFKLVNGFENILYLKMDDRN